MPQEYHIPKQSTTNDESFNDLMHAQFIEKNRLCILEHSQDLRGRSEPKDANY